MKKEPFAIIMALAVFFSLGFFGCKLITLSKKASYCDALAPGQYSVLCMIAAKLNTTPEEAAAMLKVANLSMLAADVYKAEQAQEFVRDIRGAVDLLRESGSTYNGLLDYAVGRYQVLPPELKAAFIVLKDAYQVQIEGLGETLLSDIDFEKIIKHLDDQAALIAPFAGE